MHAIHAYRTRIPRILVKLAVAAPSGQQPLLAISFRTAYFISLRLARAFLVEGVWSNGEWLRVSMVIVVCFISSFAR